MRTDIHTTVWLKNSPRYLPSLRKWPSNALFVSSLTEFMFHIGEQNVRREKRFSILMYFLDCVYMKTQILYKIMLFRGTKMYSKSRDPKFSGTLVQWEEINLWTPWFRIEAYWGNRSKLKYFFGVSHQGLLMIAFENRALSIADCFFSGHSQ